MEENIPAVVEKNIPTVAHLIAINPAQHSTAEPPIYILLDGNIIPIQIASATTPLPAPVPALPPALGAAAASSDGHKPLVKIAPLPSISASQGSCILIAGIMPAGVAGVKTPLNEGASTSGVGSSSIGGGTTGVAAAKTNLSRIHKCTFDGCNKSYTKCSHLKAHIR